MLDRLEKLEKRYQKITREMANPEIASDIAQLQKLAQEQSGIEELVKLYQEYKATAKSLESTFSFFRSSTT